MVYKFFIVFINYIVLGFEKKTVLSKLKNANKYHICDSDPNLKKTHIYLEKTTMKCLI